MLTPSNCCIQVALSINRATYCFDTSNIRYRRAEPKVPSCTFGGQVAQTAAFQGLRVTTDRAVLTPGCCRCSLRSIRRKMRSPPLWTNTISPASIKDLHPRTSMNRM